MRVALASSLIVLLACGGAATKPAESSADESSSSDSKSSTSKDPEDLAPAASGSESASPPPPPQAAAPAAPVADDTPAPAVYHPTPSVTGMIDGKPFTPKVARILTPLMSDGRVALSLVEGTTCDVSPADPTMTFTVTWKKAYKTDLASLKRASKKAVNETGFTRGKGVYSATFKPTGTVQVVSAPTTKDSTGRLTLDVTAGEYILAGGIDVLVCRSLQ